jgi:hypothetical protein
MTDKEKEAFKAGWKAGWRAGYEQGPWGAARKVYPRWFNADL